MTPPVIAEGKTKLILAVADDATRVDLRSKDDITAGDGAKHDIIPDKGRLATKTTCNVFRVLKASGVPVAFDKQIDETTFRAPRCEMLPYEVVVRAQAFGSYLKCFPHFAKGHVFETPIVQLFLKTSGKQWKQHSLPCDDPLMIFHYEEDWRTIKVIALHDPKVPFDSNSPFLQLKSDEVFTHCHEAGLLTNMDRLALEAFRELRKAWARLKRNLVDYKVEFGIGPKGELLIADVLDNDSWRLLTEEGYDASKQGYRENRGLSEVAQNYTDVAELSDQL